MEVHLDTTPHQGYCLIESMCSNLLIRIFLGKSTAFITLRKAEKFSEIDTCDLEK